MGVPNLSQVQIKWINEQVARFIEAQRAIYLTKAVPLTPKQRNLMQPFFPISLLGSVRLITLRTDRIENPPFYSQLRTMGLAPELLPDFADMGAITLVDVIVSHGSLSNPTLFHELVHVVQYAKLGLDRFAAMYVRGFLRGGAYERIPLEINAYELDSEFTRHPGRHFSVEDRVQRWIDDDRF